MIEVGEYCVLQVLRDTPYGLFLGEEGSKESVLLPGKEIPEGTSVGDSLKVFIYNDSEDRPVATTKTPGITRNSFGVLRVKDVNKMGVFLDWGLEKDLLVPFKEQYKKMAIDQEVLVFMYFDEGSERLVASGNLDRFISNKTLSVEVGDKVELIVWDSSDLGISVIINHKHKGLIYQNELFRKLSPGDQLIGYIKQIREENKLDVRLSKEIAKQIPEDSELKDNDGKLPIGDKSVPEEIYALCKMSKKAFKRAAGTLYKQRIVKINAGEIILLS